MKFFLAFIPLFVAIDPVGLLPIFVSFTQGMDRSKKRKIIFESILTGLGLSLAFIFLGRAIFHFLGITMGDFMIAGGVILFCIALAGVLLANKQSFLAAEEFGAVPLGTPLLVGPAVLTTSFILIEQFGLSATIVSVLVNLLLAGSIFWVSEYLMKLLGEGGVRVLSKVMSLLLAAIAVMLIRKGIWEVLLIQS